ncbi:hypothetical protein [Pseudomonas sp. Irchel s3b2]|uniref:hypothetical protein n=1 Tax=Pseudomonas sp. Irchel s3b2 TaxID=2009073 RepID=UPI000BA49263|nr:hypothetical protein [Pseudomonas sp. Irchel s3b2]
MARKVNRSRSQTLSLRISPIVRFGLECVANNTQTSMTNTIERAVVQAMGALLLNRPRYLVAKYEDEGKIRVTDIIELVWHEDEVIRLIRTGILAPSLLSPEDAFIYKIFSGEKKYEFKGEMVSFGGQGDVFEGEPIVFSDEYFESGLRFDLKKCQEYFEAIKEYFSCSFDFDSGSLRAFERVTIK